MLSNQRFFRFYAENILHVCPPVEHIFMSLRIGFPDSRQGFVFYRKQAYRSNSAGNPLGLIISSFFLSLRVKRNRQQQINSFEESLFVQGQCSLSAQLEAGFFFAFVLDGVNKLLNFASLFVMKECCSFFYFYFSRKQLFGRIKRAQVIIGTW